MEKKYLYKIFERDDPSSGGFIDLVDPNKVISEPVFTFEINGGQGETRIRFSSSFDDFPASFAPTNLLKIFETSDNFSLGRLLYTGQISKVRPFKEGNNQGVELVVLGLPSMLQLALFEDSGNYSPSYTNTDVTDIVKDIIDNFNSIHGPILDASGIAATGAVITETFERLSHFEAFEKAFSFAPAGYYWLIEPDGEVILRQKSSVADRRFVVERDTIDLDAPTNVEDVTNSLLLVAGGSVGEQLYEDSTSIAAYGKRQKVISNTSITDQDTADEFGNSFIADNKDPKNSPKLIIRKPFDIGSLRAGETCLVLNYRKGSGIFGDNMRIERVNYSRDKAEIFLEEQQGIFSVALKNAINKG